MVRHGEHGNRESRGASGPCEYRSSRFLALCVGEGDSVESKVAKKLVNSGECNFSGRMLKSPRIMSGVPFSEKQLRRASISS